MAYRNIIAESPVLACFLFYCTLKIFRYVYRLTFHPLAKFPGPKLAGASTLYGAYYDLVKPAVYCRKFVELHEQYGPIVRIFPNELHINDMDSYNQVFRVGTKFDKERRFYSNPVVEGAHLNMTTLAPAKARKDTLAPYFSKAAVSRLEPAIQDKVSQFIILLLNAGYRNVAVDLSLAYRCLTIDIITEYCFQKSHGALNSPGFEEPFIVALMAMAKNNADKYIPYIGDVVWHSIMVFPKKMVKWVSPTLGDIRGYQEDLKSNMMELRNNAKQLTSSVFGPMLNAETEKGQSVPSDHDLLAEGNLMVGAGTDTTAGTLCVGTWNLLNDPEALENLNHELRTVMPDRDSPVDLMTAEGLPFLRGVVKESLRLFYGAPGRLPRVVPSTGAVLCGQEIPPGTIVSHSHYVYHHDAEVFPDSFTFNPGRWLEYDPELDKHLLSFSRGSRSCLGMNLALAELYLTFARVFRRLELSAFETTAEDMDWSDNHVSVSHGHLKVKVQEHKL